MPRMRLSLKQCGRSVLPGLLAGCSYFTPVSDAPEPSRSDGERVVAVAAARTERRERPRGPRSPVFAEPKERAGRTVWQAALAAKERRIVVSVDHRWLWLMEGGEAVFGAPVAVGTSKPFTYAGTRYDFRTPRSRWEVLDKETDPLWVPPDWHYFEKAVDQDLQPVHLRKGQRYALEDGTRIEVRGDEVGRVNQFDNFWAFRPGMEIIFEGKIFIPPIGTQQRMIPEILGTHRLILGDGYLIHGTNEEDSIGEAVSHGCVRMFNEDVAYLYETVTPGTPVYIY
ncbi:MAG: L,D-transpeptidase [Longimicrobiales bacterium]